MTPANESLWYTVHVESTIVSTVQVQASDVESAKMQAVEHVKAFQYQPVYKPWNHVATSATISDLNGAGDAIN